MAAKMESITFICTMRVKLIKLTDLNGDGRLLINGNDTIADIHGFHIKFKILQFHVQ